MLDGPPWLRPGPPPYPVPVLGTFGERCDKGFRRVGPDRTGQLGCEIDWTCAAGTNGRSPAEGAQISLTGDHVVIDSDGYIRDVDNGVPCAMDAWGRKVCGGEIREPLWEGRPEKWWGQFAACDPVACAAETPVPTARPAPGPTLPPIVGACSDRAMDFVNGCDALRYPKKLDDGRVRGQCDSTERIGCRFPDGEYYRNACDQPHWTGDSESARKTRALCDHNGEPRDWDAHDGVRLEVLEGSVETDRDESNPFQWWLTAAEGTVVVIRACPASSPIRTEDGRTLPVRGDGCGAWKPVKFEVK